MANAHVKKKNEEERKINQENDAHIPQAHTAARHPHKRVTKKRSPLPVAYHARGEPHIERTHTSRHAQTYTHGDTSSHDVCWGEEKIFASFGQLVAKALIFCHVSGYPGGGETTSNLIINKIKTRR